MVENKTVWNQACRKGCLGMNCVYKGWGKSQPISPPFGHKAGLPPSKKYLLVRQPLLSSKEDEPQNSIKHYEDDEDNRCKCEKSGDKHCGKITFLQIHLIIMLVQFFLRFLFRKTLLKIIQQLASSWISPARASPWSDNGMLQSVRVSAHGTPEPQSYTSRYNTYNVCGTCSLQAG